MIKKGKKVSLTAHQNEQRTIEPIVIVSSVGKNTISAYKWEASQS
jgi:hypothetical protein